MRGGWAFSALPLACLAVAALRVGPATRDALHYIGVDANLSVVYARLSVANTGLLDAQATTRLVVISPGSPVIQHRAMSGPAEVGPDGIRAGTDALQRTEEGWELRANSEDLGARLHATGATTDCPPRIGRMSGFVGSHAAEDGQMLDGAVAIVRTRAEGPVTGEALYVVGPGFAAGVDPLADCPAWVRAGERVWTGAPPAVRETVQLGAWRLLTRRMGGEVVQDALAHLLGPERWFAQLAGYHPRVIVRRVVVEVEGPGVSGSRGGLLLARE